MRLKLAVILILISIPVMIFPGDVAHFVNLGFSRDSRYFLFGYYGVNEKTSLAYAELYAVNVPSNSFVPDGRILRQYPNEIEAGNDGLGGIFDIFMENRRLVSSYGIDLLSTGRILYFLVDGEVPKDQLDFRDFVTKKRYMISLIQSSWGTGKAVQSSFYIEMTIQNSAGSTHQVQLGRPLYKRQGVRNYRIKEIILAPDSKSFVFVIEKAEEDSNGVNVRYMVETARVNF
ncbi:MAG: DUF2259 domain-containing protein [Spirochaetales bacterium]|nr:DUF2259 domain-containing protein [Spirochaetales bacterium]